MLQFSSSADIRKLPIFAEYHRLEAIGFYGPYPVSHAVQYDKTVYYHNIHVNLVLDMVIYNVQVILT